MSTNSSGSNGNMKEKNGNGSNGNIKETNGNGNGDQHLNELLNSNQPVPIWVRCVVVFVRILFFIYDVISYIPFAIFASPTEKLKRSKRVKAKPTVDNDPSSPWTNVDNEDGKLLTELIPDCPTLDRLWQHLVAQYGDSPCLGTREVIRVHQEKQSNGRVFEKLELGEYYWSSYDEVDERVNAVAAGLIDIGHQRDEKLVIFADTREEWMITALACFQNGFIVTTVYATLGEDATPYAINQVAATTIVTSSNLLPKVAAIAKHCKTLKRVVYFAPTNPEADDPDVSDLNRQFDVVLSFDELIERGEDKKQNENDTERPNANDIALIMYTSGTTGNPKGVMITHNNIIAALAGQTAAIPHIDSNDRIIGYLPLAHILEMCCELLCLSRGVRIGYSSPLTLYDRGSMIKKGTHGDCYALKPTIMACVPTIMDRIYKTAIDEVAHSPPLMRELFRISYERKRSRYEEGYNSFLLNRMAFGPIRNILGGQLRAVVSGGAPLNSETQRFMNICFCCPVIQGYGLTETCGGGTAADGILPINSVHLCHLEHDLSTGTVGPPLRSLQIMLREWKEAGYSPNGDKVQGEVMIHGGNVALGYFQNEEKTKEDFINIDGKIWFATGDIGEFRPDGSLNIIDRKKDLLKLDNGEYVSLGRIESTLITNRYVDNICIVGNSFHSYVIALIVPNRKHLIELAEKHNIDETNFQRLCHNESIVDALRDELTSFAQNGKLNKSEIPTKIHLCTDVWTSASGMLTEALKLKRRNIEEKYRSVIKKFFAR